MGYPVRPSGYVGWGSTGMTNVAEPTDAKKAAGWSISEKPASSYFNWILSKQDELLQHLRWRTTELSTVVEDDFAYSKVWTPFGYTSIGHWDAFFPAAGQPWNPVDGDDKTLSIGRYFGIVGGRLGQLGTSGYGEILRMVGNKSARDFFMEHVVARYVASGSATAIGAELGLMFQHSGASGFNPLLAWVMTGLSNYPGVRYTPSGAASPTSIAFSPLTPVVTPTGLVAHKFTVESRGPTMCFYIDDALQASVPAVVIGSSGPNAHYFGVRFGGASHSSHELVVDYMKFAVGRRPV